MPYSYYTILADAIQSSSQRTFRLSSELPVASASSTGDPGASWGPAWNPLPCSGSVLPGRCLQRRLRSVPELQAGPALLLREPHPQSRSPPPRPTPQLSVSLVLFRCVLGHWVQLVGDRRTGTHYPCPGCTKVHSLAALAISRICSTESLHFQTGVDPSRHCSPAAQGEHEILLLRHTHNAVTQTDAPLSTPSYKILLRAPGE